MSVEPRVTPGRHLDEERCRNSFLSIGLSAVLAALVVSSHNLSISSIILPDGGRKVYLHMMIHNP